MENHGHVPKAEQQIAEIARDALTELADGLEQRGHGLALQQLGTMYVHVELDRELRRRVQDRVTRR